ncbi:hypothetical protein C3F09_00990 [candidate division GN15 bacterium]|uniref:Glycosyltransferase subfamily 4-like N-terminal domain-containing protein n=1 Tax=candidate division GN15 bacterium TaxID=2072418 RepID=A0A855XBL8_9BACT|nr:MAG: hypothetical protein C3F09_00990 [candidate division GN15 bacterium]
MEPRPKRLLIVTYVFPPFAAVGVYRILKFCKYLPEFGISPVILTPNNPNTMARDEGLMAQVPHYVPVHHTPTVEPFRWRPEVKSSGDTEVKQSLSAETGREAEPGLVSRFKQTVKQNLSIPDTSYFWRWSGLWTGLRAVKEEKVDLILSSSPPHSAHLLAAHVASRTHKPLIVDFRDLWTQNTSYAERKLSPALGRRDRRYELSVLRQAAGITVNTDTFKAQLMENNSFLRSDQIDVVTNGFDPDDFKEFVASGTGENRFTLLYTGSLYGGHRNPEFFFTAVRMWMNQRPEVAGQIRLLFIGNWAPEHAGLIERHGLGEVIVKRDWMPQREALKETFAADLLLLFQGFDPALAAAIPRKLYEYMITNKPIMAFAPPGEIPDLITQYDCGVSFSSPEAEPIIAFLDEAFNTWKHRRETGQTTHALRSMPALETRQQVRRLADMCHRLA